MAEHAGSEARISRKPASLRARFMTFLIFSCDCLAGFDGPRCQQTHHSFQGDGWAWFEPLSQCEDSHTSVEFATTSANGVLLYNGPMTPAALATGANVLLTSYILCY